MIAFRMIMRAKYANFHPPMHEPEVTFFLAKSEPVSLFEVLPARVVSTEISEIRPQATGVIWELKFQEGGTVKKGDHLYLIDPTPYRITYEKAKSALKTAAEKKERYEKLVKQHAVSVQDYQSVLDAFISALSDVKTAQTNLDYTKIYAPISGFITSSSVTKGALVVANQMDVLATITRLDPIYVEMIQARQEATRIGKLGEIPVSVILETGELSEPGHLLFSEVIVDPDTDAIKLRAKFSNPDGVLMPGMFVRAKLHLDPFIAILIPQRATVRDPDGSLNVWILDSKEQTVKKRKIIAENTLGNMWVVTDGLKEDEAVVLEGIVKVRENAKVKPTYSKP
jgi:RND family efflux transporter MFP subunit